MGNQMTTFQALAVNAFCPPRASVKPVDDGAKACWIPFVSDNVLPRFRGGRALVTRSLAAARRCVVSGALQHESLCSKSATSDDRSSAPRTVDACVDKRWIVVA
jgi:hypothetical protein